ncbi:hypothetical protein ACWGI8_42295, partial [Streptomyces sp. NPDC054841]
TVTQNGRLLHRGRLPRAADPERSVAVPAHWAAGWTAEEVRCASAWAGAEPALYRILNRTGGQCP